MPGIELIFKHREVADEVRERGIQVGYNPRYTILPIVLKIKKRAGAMDPYTKKQIITAVKHFGEILFLRCEDECLRLNMVLRNNIPRDAIPN